MRKSRRRMAPNTTTTTKRPVASYLTRWALPTLWALLPFVAGPALADALDPVRRSTQVVASIGAWVAWGVVLGATLVPRTTTLTLIRIVTPASVLVTIGAALGAPLSASSVAGVGWSIAVTIIVLSAFTGELYVNGSAYGDERRLPLRPPAGLLIGPLWLAWIACLVGTAGGPLLLANENWIAGGVLLILGWPMAYVSARALHNLSNRWLVFVPAGIVLHDLLAVTDPVMVPRRMVRRLGPAPADSTATDFTLGSYGLALQVDLTEATPVTTAPRRTRPGQRPPLETIEVDALLFTPSRPGAVLREAATRRLAVA